MHLGYVIPDLPRFLQRILLFAVPRIDPYYSVNRHSTG
jgi:hypothetical protein